MEPIWKIDADEPPSGSVGFSNPRDAISYAKPDCDEVRMFRSDDGGRTWKSVEFDFREFACLCVKGILGYCYDFLTEEMEQYLESRDETLRVELREGMSDTPFWGTNFLIAAAAWISMRSAVSDCPISAAIGAMTSASYCAGVAKSELWLRTDPNLHDPALEERQRELLLDLLTRESQ